MDSKAVNYGPMIRFIEDTFGDTMDSILIKWLQREISIYEGVEELCRRHHVYGSKNKRRIRRAFQRYLRNYFTKEDIRKFKNRTKSEEYARRIAKYYQISPEMVIDFIVGNHIPIAKVVRDVGDPNGNLYSWIYNQIRNEHGRCVVQKLCTGEYVNRSGRCNTSLGYFGAHMTGITWDLLANVLPSREVFRLDL